MPYLKHLQEDSANQQGIILKLTILKRHAPQKLRADVQPQLSADVYSTNAMVPLLSDLKAECEHSGPWIQLLAVTQSV